LIGTPTGQSGSECIHCERQEIGILHLWNRPLGMIGAALQTVSIQIAPLIVNLLTATSIDVSQPPTALALAVFRVHKLSPSGICPGRWVLSAPRFV
jgi:hypothetical protein